jgi:hypothetical protein
MIFELELRDDIVFASFPKGMILNLDKAKEMVEQRLALQAGQPYPLVLHLNGFITNSKDARKYMANEGIKDISMGAIIVNKKYEEVVINVLLAFDQPAIPVKVFLHEDEAIQWINDHRNSPNDALKKEQKTNAL